MLGFYSLQLFIMSYIIAIPSYKRASQLQNKTLSCLSQLGIQKELINIFVVQEEYQLYLEVLNPLYYNKIIIGKLGLVYQREFIQNYYPANTCIVSLDDDIETIDLSLVNYKSLHHFFDDAFKKCYDNGVYLWSVYPVLNPFFRETKKPITIGLHFCIGAFYGFINRFDNDLTLKLTREGNKEDVERSILYWLKDGKTLRFNKIGFKTKYYGIGGLGGLKDRLEIMKSATIELNNGFPSFTRIKIRKNGLYEIVFKEKPKTLPNAVQVLDFIDPSRDDVLEIYDLLNNINIPVCDNKQGRAKSFGRHRSMTLGMVTARVSRKYGLSLYTKKYFHLYQLLLKFGKTICPFEFNAIHINHNVVCPRHLDGNNKDNSLLVSFGDYKGCNIVVEGCGEYDTNCRPIIFNGGKHYHYNTPLKEGTKFSLVFFTRDVSKSLLID